MDFDENVQVTEEFHSRRACRSLLGARSAQILPVEPAEHKEFIDLCWPQREASEYPCQKYYGYFFGTIQCISKQKHVYMKCSGKTKYEKIWKYFFAIIHHMQAPLVPSQLSGRGKWSRNGKSCSGAQRIDAVQRFIKRCSAWSCRDAASHARWWTMGTMGVSWSQISG